MFASLRWLAALLHIATFAVLSSAVDLAFTKPGFNNVAASGYPYFSVGQDVQISWTTPWEETTLVVFQNVNGKVYYDVLADTNGPSNTSITWTAGGVKSKPLAGATFHFYLQNSNNFNCNTCYINSRVFQITAATTTSTTRSAPRTTITSTPSGKTRMGTNPTSSSVGAAGAASTDNAEQSGSGSGNDLSIPLGVGLGAGIPVFLALCGIVFMFFHIRRKRAEQQQEAYSEKGLVVGGYTDSSPSADTPPARTSGQHARSSGRPESGALGPWQNSPSPTYDQQQYYQQYQQQQQYQPQQQYQQQQQEDWQRQRQAAYDEEDLDALPVVPGAAAQGRPRHSSQKYDYMPFTPALPTQFEADESRQSSRHGWIDEFDFERPGYQNADEMSELRQSLHEAPGTPDGRPKSQKSQFSYHANRASIGDVSEIPQVPQPVHGYDVGIGDMPGDSNWPLR